MHYGHNYVHTVYLIMLIALLYYIRGRAVLRNLCRIWLRCA